MGGGAIAGRFGFGLIVGIAVLASAWTAALGQTLVPVDAGQRLQAVIAQAESYRQQTGRAAAGLQNAALARIYGDNAQRNADASISAAVIGEIARQPRLASAIVSRAIELAPASQNAIINAVQAGFPGYATPGRADVSFLGVPPSTRQAPIFGRPAIPSFRAAAVQAPSPTFGQEPRASDEMAAGVSQLEQINDPLESVNRAIFAFNDVVDTFTLRPIAAAYSYVTPNVARVAVRRAVRNLNSPVVLVNDLLQFDPVGAGVTTGRFLINTTAGIFGLFDVAKLIGLEEHHSDFGQTLFDYGLGPGPYVVLPILGPSTTRDASGRLVDVFFDPLTYILEGDAALGVAAGRGLVRREEVIDPLEKLRALSVDYYAALRSAYYQDRAIELGISKAGESTVDNLFDSAE